MFSFIKKHWVFYLVGAIVAVALGFALALFVGAKGSTPENLHADDVVQEATDSTTVQDGAAEGDAAVQGDVYAEGGTAASGEAADATEGEPAA